MSTKIFSQKFLFLAVSLLLLACLLSCVAKKKARKGYYISFPGDFGVKVTEDNAKIIYYDVEADGYIIDGYTNKPVAGARVNVASGCWHQLYPMGPYIEKNYYADSNGYYRIRLVDTINEKPTWDNGYSIHLLDSTRISIRWGSKKWLDPWGGKGFRRRHLDSAQTTIRIDTAKIFPRDSVIIDLQGGRHRVRNME